MVLHCCVTLCKSLFERNINILFCEFQSDNHIRSSWLKVIYRKDFYSNDQSNSSRLCSKHFKELLYVLFLKQRCHWKYQLITIVHEILICLLFPFSSFVSENFTLKIFPIIIRLKNKIENNSTWEGAFYQSEWVKINWSWVALVFFHFMCIVVSTSELF